MKTISNIALLSLLTLIASAQDRRERKELERTESAQPREVPGGVTFQVNVPLETAFETVLTAFKRKEYAIESADKVLGRIGTGMTVTGGYIQTGSRVIVVFIKDSDSQTSIRVTTTAQKRKKLLQAEPWENPKLDVAATAKAIDELKALFGVLPER